MSCDIVMKGLVFFIFINHKIFINYTQQHLFSAMNKKGYICFVTYLFNYFLSQEVMTGLDNVNIFISPSKPDKVKNWK